MTLEDFLPLCESIGRSFARSYPPVDAEDISQECALLLVDNLDGLLSKVSEPEAQTAYVRKALERRATSFCRSERAEIVQATDQYSYRPEDVRSAVPAFLEYRAKVLEWSEAIGSDSPSACIDVAFGSISLPPVPEDGKSIKPGDGLAVMTDVALAWDHLRAEDRYAIEDHVSSGGGLDGSSRMKVSRAYDNLTRRMNGEGRMWHEGPGSRRIVSNAQAQAMTGNDY